MSRFDPNTYPDRLEFEAYAHRIRARELGKLFHAAGAWEQDRQHELVGRLRQIRDRHFLLFASSFDTLIATGVGRVRAPICGWSASLKPGRRQD